MADADSRRSIHSNRSRTLFPPPQVLLPLSRRRSAAEPASPPQALDRHPSMPPAPRSMPAEPTQQKPASRPLHQPAEPPGFLSYLRPTPESQQLSFGSSQQPSEQPPAVRLRRSAYRRQSAGRHFLEPASSRSPLQTLL